MSKIAVKSPVGALPKPASGSWSSAAPRLAKARSSPNVSKAAGGLSAAKQAVKIDDGASTATAAPRRQTATGRTSTGLLKSQQSSSSGIAASKSTRGSNNNVTIVQISGDNDTPQPKPPRASTLRSRASDATNRQSKSSSTPTSRPEAAKKKPSKEASGRSGSPSCTILEDRVLLKKGLSSPPSDKSKLPKKPDELRKKSLNRSTSLWSVQTGHHHDAVKQSRSTKSADSKLMQKNSRSRLQQQQHQQQQPTGLNRATSLWSVPADPQCRLGKMPSRIPLSTQHLAGLGQSLGDLSLVDRSSAEKPQLAVVKRVIDFDEVDRSVDEHIYENCREAIVKNDEDVVVVIASPIYENLNKSATDGQIKEPEEKAKKPELAGSLSVPLTTSELEKRAEQLLSELDEDDSATTTKTVTAVTTVVVQPPVPPPKLQSSKKKIDLNVCRINIERSKDILSRSRENLNRSREELARSKENLTKTQEALEKSRMLAKSQDSLQILHAGKRTECEINIQEIRRNWERQIEKCQVINEDPKVVKSRLTKSSTNINGISRADLTLPLIPDTNNLCNKTKKSPTLQAGAKRTKDIEHLVNFFNCKNTDTSPSKPSSPIVIQDSWTKQPLTKDTPDVTVIKTPTSDKGEKSCGYASDGNSSEDSGHISNENEPEHEHDHLDELKDFKNHRKNELFIEEIIQDLDSSLERTIEVFEATPLVRRFDQSKKEPPLPPPKISIVSSSSGASSIDSWGDEAARKSTAVIKPTPTQRQDVPSQQQVYGRC